MLIYFFNSRSNDRFLKDFNGDNTTIFAYLKMTLIVLWVIDRGRAESI